MAGVRFNAVTASVATGVVAKTVAQIVAAANQRVLVKEIHIAFAGTSNTNEPIKVDIMRQTDAGTMSALTLVKGNNSDDETLQSTAQHTATVEPASGDVIMTIKGHPQTSFSWQAPFGGEIPVIGGGRVGFRVTAANDVGAFVSIVGEE